MNPEIAPHGKLKIGTLDIYGGDHRISRIFLWFNICILGGLLAEIFILVISGDFFQADILVGVLPLVLFGFYFTVKGKFEASAIFLAIILFTFVTILATFGLGIHHLSNLGFPAILIVASLVVSWRSLMILNAYAIACVAWLVFGEILHLYTPHALVGSVVGDFFTTSIILLVTSFMIQRLMRALMESKLETQKELVERHLVEKRLEYGTLHDSLTRLPNRMLFYDRLSQRLEETDREPDELFAVLFLDLDRFKVINDSLGHMIGDQMLIGAATRLLHCVRPEDTVARLGGDEFGIILNKFNDVSDVLKVAERVLDQLSSVSLLENFNRVSTASIGIAIYNDHYSSAQEILRDADAAMYQAKAKGGGQFALFDESMYASALSLLQMEADLQKALKNNEFEIQYQPIAQLPERKIIGAEALLRWNHPIRGLISPLEFIGVAEETGMIHQIGEFVLREACRQIVEWRNTSNPVFWVSVNLSPRQFQANNLIETIEKTLHETGCPGAGLHLEITESVAMKDFDYSLQVLERLNQLGIQVLLDDFGVGYSSLSYLNRFPIQALKIDSSFVAESGEKHSNDAILRGIISMSHALNLQVIAEGVETVQQISLLEAIGCNYVQGHLFSSADGAGALEKLL